MKYLQHIIIYLLFTPLLSFILWLFTAHTWINLINVTFYISMILAIIFFIILITQEGILDPTSFGFRRLKYQLTRKKHRHTLDEDEFFKPTKVKKDVYIVSPWVKIGFICNLVYIAVSILISFAI
ncbi:MULTISPECIES: DUF3899 domain-containing protein [Staphylococcus]|jgi:hypothetical protein|uniref:DUF3899 domain-containing protein n=1 Tax=Staphylococcus TaxID=1279 RepID=UPI000E02B3F2|nr:MULTISPECIES: DUF3899 domain-containing protein [Staphylococcus]MBO1220326.1 DUF3899 domain-containing protein [Staphylococcus nepalensis]MCD8890771.1 DUF3899 domain-containing protein [Staphylococcus nepalensis]MDR5648944.1 DUF3899 domain-containing protein [Staphylococcus nepalensis]MDW8551208.1 DUF3899 domain-containing protein [Staphylococcus nepalensis]RIO41796.1 DUF3899 domain-containing protein [Staphylococcus nepalensis]